MPSTMRRGVLKPEMFYTVAWDWVLVMILAVIDRAPCLRKRQQCRTLHLYCLIDAIRQQHTLVALVCAWVYEYITEEMCAKLRCLRQNHSLQIRSKLLRKTHHTEQYSNSNSSRVLLNLYTSSPQQSLPLHRTTNTRQQHPAISRAKTS